MLTPVTLQGEHGAYCVLGVIVGARRAVTVWATAPDTRYLTVCVPYDRSTADGIAAALDDAYLQRVEAKAIACAGPRPFSPAWLSMQDSPETQL